MSASPDSIRVPAEWESQDSIWLAMPHDAEEWGPAFAEACRSVRELVGLLVESGETKVDLLVTALSDTPVHPQAREHLCEFGDIWLRDTGPIFLHRNARLEAAAFAFNGWGGKYLFPHDSEVAELIGELSQTPIQRHGLVLEGGAIDGNGAGTFLTTRECLLHTNRNPNLDQAAIEAMMAEALGAGHLIWLERGLLGDHTDGHVDNIARFVAANKVVHMLPNGPSDPNAEILREIQRELSEARTAEGEPLVRIELPSPGAVHGPKGLMAASYCNFLITNGCVVVPTFDRPSDKEALSVFADLFPERRIVGLDACHLLTGGGTVHCISQQQPSAPSSH